jgi:hypothetical protein
VLREQPDDENAALVYLDGPSIPQRATTQATSMAWSWLATEVHYQFRLERLDLARKIHTCHAVDQTKVASGWSRASSPMRF